MPLCARRWQVYRDQGIGSLPNVTLAIAEVAYHVDHPPAGFRGSHVSHLYLFTLAFFGVMCGGRSGCGRGGGGGGRAALLRQRLTRGSARGAQLVQGRLQKAGESARWLRNDNQMHLHAAR